ncbi:MAG: hypothetical protein K2K44_12665 [Oscillospiraceae bacterium]|nr:hypothetical protein [Oscillospiraceae bacterium]
MRSIKVILAGIVLILASIFFMGVIIIPEEFTLGVFIIGIVICVIGLFFVKDNDTDVDDDYDDEYYEDNDNEE